MNNARFEREHIDVALSQFLCLNEKIGFAPGSENWSCVAGCFLFISLANNRLALLGV